MRWRCADFFLSFFASSSPHSTEWVFMELTKRSARERWMEKSKCCKLMTLFERWRLLLPSSCSIKLFHQVVYLLIHSTKSAVDGRFRWNRRKVGYQNRRYSSRYLFYRSRESIFSAECESEQCIRMIQRWHARNRVTSSVQECFRVLAMIRSDHASSCSTAKLPRSWTQIPSFRYESQHIAFAMILEIDKICFPCFIIMRASRLWQNDGITSRQTASCSTLKLTIQYYGKTNGVLNETIH